MWFSENWAKIVAIVVTPVVAGVSAWFSVWAATHLPGAPEIDPDALAGIASAGALAAGAALYKYLDNRGAHERQQVELDNLPQIPGA